MTLKKIALVTGGSKGIGKACCFELRKKGYFIALHYRSNEREAKALAIELGECQLYAFDLACDGACEELIKAVKKDHGSLDLLVNNAGATLNKLLAFSKVEDFDFLININLRPVFLLSKLASRLMIRQKKGSIINISSVVAFTGNGGQTLYSATKGAVVSFTKALAMELGALGIRVNCVAPGYIETNMTEDLPKEAKEKILKQIPLSRFGKADEVAKLVSFLASEDSSYITGSTLHINGGLLRV